MRKVLRTLYVVMERGNKKRLNPYNPLSYILIVVVLFVALLLFGFIGIKNEVDFKNPFKWRY